MRTRLKLRALRDLEVTPAYVIETRPIGADPRRTPWAEHLPGTLLTLQQVHDFEATLAPEDWASAVWRARAPQWGDTLLLREPSQADSFVHARAVHEGPLPPVGWTGMLIQLGVKPSAD